jgi:hypothetical protein
MHRIALLLIALACFAAPAAAAEVTVVTVETSAQEDADRMAASGRLGHFGRRRGGYEGVGFSTRSASDALANCCYWNKRKAIQIGTARGPRGWYACVRYR